MISISQTEILSLPTFIVAVLWNAHFLGWLNVAQNVVFCAISGMAIESVGESAELRGFVVWIYWHDRLKSYVPFTKKY